MIFIYIYHHFFFLLYRNQISLIRFRSHSSGLLSVKEHISICTFFVSSTDKSVNCCNLVKIFCSELDKDRYFRFLRLMLGDSRPLLKNI